HPARPFGSGSSRHKRHRSVEKGRAGGSLPARPTRWRCRPVDLLDTRTAPSQTAHDMSSVKIPLGIGLTASSTPNGPLVHSRSVSRGPIPGVAAADSDQAGSSELGATPGRLKQRTDYP